MIFSERYHQGLLRRLQAAGVSRATAITATHAGSSVPAAVLVANAESFLNNSILREELFGPATLVTKCKTREHLEEIARSLDGQLTVTLHATEEDLIF